MCQDGDIEGMRARQKDLTIAFWFSVIVHCALGLCSGSLLIPRADRVAPMFRQGESALDLTLVAVSRSADEIEAAKESERAEPPEISVEPPQEKRNVEDIPSEVRADMLEKGVRMPFEGVTDVQDRVRYPPNSIRRGEEGTVTVRVVVGPAGKAIFVEIVESSGYPALDREAVRGVEGARFTASNGSAIESEMVYSFRFELTN